MSQSKDRTLKYIGVNFLAVLLSLLNLGIDFDLTDVEDLTDEIIILESQLKRPDRVIRIGNIILMIEFQSTYVTTNLKKKFKLYVSSFDYAKNPENSQILFCVLSTQEKSKWVEYSSGPWDTFQFPIFSFRDLNLEEIINNVKSKIESNNDEVFTIEELVKLAVTPLIPIKREDIIKQFYETAYLISEIDFPDPEMRDSVCGIVLMLSDLYFEKDDPLRKQIQGVYMNKGDCIQEFGEEKYDEGKSKAKEDYVKNMLDDNVPLEKISQYTGLSVSEIEKIRESR